MNCDMFERSKCFDIISLPATCVHLLHKMQINVQWLLHIMHIIIKKLTIMIHFKTIAFTDYYE